MINVYTLHPFLRFPSKETFRIISGVLRGEGYKKLSIMTIFVNHTYIRRLNKLFLKRNYVTDVIAFPLMDGWGVDAEIYINLDSAKMQSKKYNVTFYEEVRRLLIHGTLHLLGYNDLTVRQRKQMTEKEDYYLSKLVKKGNEKRCKGI